jgi:hypothetical protein
MSMPVHFDLHSYQRQTLENEREKEAVRDDFMIRVTMLKSFCSSLFYLFCREVLWNRGKRSLDYLRGIMQFPVPKQHILAE